uniref:Uncharacterized protein n=1 Tax=Anguilla anguilla TaxID=7936 RepID=A0A0E9SUS1_ANGAN
MVDNLQGCYWCLRG